ncbi:MAG: hypothetical protein ACO280_11665, partial [Pseudohongiellaceae bacterium]
KHPPVSFLFANPPPPYIFLLHSGHSRNYFGAMIPVEPTAEHSIPFDLTDEQPKTHADAVAVAVNTADLIGQLGGSIDFDNEDLHKAKALITGEGKSKTPKHVASAAEAAAAHHLIRKFDFNAFSDALQARNYITNRLIALTDCGDPKLELKALELLGKHSDIGLFTERSEITVHHTTSKSLEDSIKERVKRLMNADVTDVTNMLDELDTVEESKRAQKSAEIEQVEPDVYKNSDEIDVNPENPDE